MRPLLWPAFCCWILAVLPRASGDFLIEEVFQADSSTLLRVNYSSINDAGQIGFTTRDNSGVEQIIRRETNGSYTQLFDTSVSGGGVLYGARLNGLGDVAFSRDLAAVGSPARYAITVASDAGARDLLDSATSNLNDIISRGFNDSGTVAFRATFTSNTRTRVGIFTVDTNGSVVTVNEHARSGSSIRSQIPDLNNAGEIAVQSLVQSTGLISQLVGAPGNIEIIDDRFAFPRTSDINNNGDVLYVDAFQELQDGNVVNKEQLFYRAAGGTTPTLIVPANQVDFADALVGLNDQSQVVFLGTDEVGLGLFTSTDRANFQSIIRVGDSLFGSTVQGLQYQGAINNSGKIVFEYTLANGQFGIASAIFSVPEPGSLSLVGAVLLVLANFRRRQLGRV